MGKITSGQLFVWLFLSRMFTFFTFLPGVAESVNSSVSLVFMPLYLLLSALVMLPVLAVLAKNPGKGILEIAFGYSSALGHIFSAVLVLIAVIMLGDTLTQYFFFLETVVYPDISPFLFLVLFCAAAVWITLMGLEGTARFSGFTLIALIGFLACVFLSLSKEYSSIPLVNPLIFWGKPVLRGTVTTFAATGELLLAAVLASYVRGSIIKGFLGFIGSTAGVLLTLSLLVLTSVGSYAAVNLYPIYASAKAARLFTFLRLDALSITIISILGLLKCALWIFAAGKAVSLMLPKPSVNKYLAPVVGAAGVLIMILLVRQYGAFIGFYRTLLSGIPLAAALLAPPAIIGLCALVGKKGDRGN